jgi:hypothetical protein
MDETRCRYEHIYVVRRTDPGVAMYWLQVTPGLTPSIPEAWRDAYADFERKNKQSACLTRVPTRGSSAGSECDSVRLVFSRAGVDSRKGRAVVALEIFKKKKLLKSELHELTIAKSRIEREGGSDRWRSF